MWLAIAAGRYALSQERLRPSVVGWIDGVARLIALPVSSLNNDRNHSQRQFSGRKTGAL